MASKYNHNQIEEKWMRVWEDENLFQETYKEDIKDPIKKRYILFAFAYPSGDGLHVGHVESKTALDVISRFSRMKGYNVFFPVGWDAFGLPAENYAVKTGIHPKETTKKAIHNFGKQCKRIGVSYDWKTEIATSHPDYYKWTQWLFLQFYKDGRAYKALAPANWCPSCNTVLANEQVVDGQCDRCDTEVVQKELEQWFFKITDYREQLLKGLEKVDWPEATKQQQRNWIGKSEGMVLKFLIDGNNGLSAGYTSATAGGADGDGIPDQVGNDSEMVGNDNRTVENNEGRGGSGSIEVFTTRPDTIFGATFMALAPEHPIIKSLLKGEFKVSDETRENVGKYVEETKTKTEEERLINKEKTGVFTGLYAVNPANGEKLPVWVSDYVLMGYGTGAIMAVPAHDERDFAFAEKFGLDVKPVIEGESLPYVGPGTMINSGELNGTKVPMEIEKVFDWVESKGIGKRETTYKLRDWLISRQRYWGAPIPIVYGPKGNPRPVKEEHLPWMLPEDVDFKPTGESPLRLSKEFVERTEKLYGKGWRPEYDTMDTFVDSSWYYMRFADPRNTKEFASKNRLDKWLPVDFYMIGAEHTVLHLLYARFFTKFLRDKGYLEFDEPFTKMRHQGMVLGPDNKKMSKSKGNVINPDEVIKNVGADALRMYEMFMGPIDADKPWDDGALMGVHRFLNKSWDLFNNKVGETASDTIVPKLHRTIKKVGDDIESLKYNTAIAAMMEFQNLWAGESEARLSKDDALRYLKVLAPFAPFMAEEVYRNVLGYDKSIHLQKWPKYDANLIVDAVVEIPVQVNGVHRANLSVEQNKLDDKAYVTDLAKTAASKYWEGKEVKKEIYVKGRIVNLVVGGKVKSLK